MVISQYIQNVKVNVTTEDVSVATTPKTDGPYVKVNTQPVTYTGSGIVYTPIGTLDPLEMLSKTPEGFKIGDVINVSKEFTTDWTFVEGEGKTYPVGTNIVVVEHDGRKAFDVLGGFIDLKKYDNKVDSYQGDDPSLPLLYSRLPSGADDVVPTTTIPHPNRVPIYDDMSRLKVSTPAAPNDVAPKGYVDDKVASAVSSVYRIKGSIPASSITASKLQDSEIGDVYNVIGTFITNDYFIEGVIETEHPSGSNIVVVLDANNVKKWDILGSTVDLTTFNTRIDELDDKKLNKTGGYVSGDLYVKNGVSILEGNGVRFENNTNNGITSLQPSTEAETDVSLTLPTESGTLATKQKVEEQLAGKLDIIQPSANTRYVYSTHYSAVTSQNPQPLAISTGNASVNTLPMYIKVDNPAFDLPLESQKATFLVATPLYNAQCANKEYVDQFGIEIVR